MQMLLALVVLLFGTCYSQKVILISLDGFRHDYIEYALKNGRNVSAFQRIASEGFRGMKVQSVMVTLTFPSHFTLATGRNVERHGLVGNTFYDPDFDEGYKYTDAKINLQPKWFTMNNNEQIWLTNQRNGGKSGVVYWPGSDSRMYGEMEYVNFGLYSSLPSIRYRVDRVMDWITKPDVNFVAMYYNEPDSSGHKYGPDSKEVLEAVEEVNDGIAYLLQRIEESNDFDEPPNIIVTSDHGMTRVNHTKIVNVSSVLSPSQYRFGVDGSPATLGIWQTPGGLSLDEIYAKLKKLNNCDVYWKKDIPAEYHFKDNKRIAPIVVFPHIGWMVQTNASDPYKDTLNGMHGYNNSEPDMHPFIVAMGPGIRNLGTVPVFYQVDVYALVCLLLKIYKPNVVDSDVYRVAPFVKYLPSMDVLRQFDRYAKGLDPLSGGSMMLAGNISLMIVLMLAIQLILRH
ncbi:Bis(5'-adenosyl)-triphosphatase enpp4 [Echinococcus granulosus]|uniref:Ectonucleotide pyrophosphatase:phosphodiesterase n=1 Tax=Echinococcus granulosus TaxID=6210 RepID=A0A068WQ73_ECHGR|nr:Bis(5'-adenosyl)-triphosphatase enpp4 [Echinococcus granulosus]CDS20666.1 ectonucleotide pyrophosphatase:phosphodiesterase [Echinococcus granulosus]